MVVCQFQESSSPCTGPFGKLELQICCKTHWPSSKDFLELPTNDCDTPSQEKFQVQVPQAVTFTGQQYNRFVECVKSKEFTKQPPNLKNGVKGEVEKNALLSTADFLKEIGTIFNWPGENATKIWNHIIEHRSAIYSLVGKYRVELDESVDNPLKMKLCLAPVESQKRPTNSMKSVPSKLLAISSSTTSLAVNVEQERNSAFGKIEEDLKPKFDALISIIPASIRIYLGREESDLKLWGVIATEIQKLKEQNDKVSTLIPSKNDEVANLKEQISKLEKEVEQCHSKLATSNVLEMEFYAKALQNYDYIVAEFSKLSKVIGNKRAYENSVRPQSLQKDEISKEIQTLLYSNENTPITVKFGDNNYLEMDKEDFKNQVGVGKAFEVRELARFVYSKLKSKIDMEVYTPTGAGSGKKPWPHTIIKWMVDFAIQNQQLDNGKLLSAHEMEEKIVELCSDIRKNARSNSKRKLKSETSSSSSEPSPSVGEPVTKKQKLQ